MLNIENLKDSKIITILMYKDEMIFDTVLDILQKETGLRKYQLINILLKETINDDNIEKIFNQIKLLMKGVQSCKSGKYM